MKMVAVQEKQEQIQTTRLKLLAQVKGNVTMKKLMEFVMIPILMINRSVSRLVTLGEAARGYGQQMERFN